MAHPDNLVTIVNGNGKKGRVPASYPPLVAGHLRLAPSERDGREVPADDPSIEVDPTSVPELPSAGASTAVWQAHASSDAGREFATSKGLDPDEVATRSRDDLVALFTSKE
jgi:hypothetical protein